MRIFHQSSFFNGIIFISLRGSSCHFVRKVVSELMELSLFPVHFLERRKIFLLYCYILLSSSIVLLSSYIGTWLLQGKLVGIALSRTQIIRDSIYFRSVAFRNCAKNCACIFSGRGKIMKFIVRDHG